MGRTFWLSVLCLLCISNRVFLSPISSLSPCLAVEPGLRSHISFALGLETLGYTEHEPDMSLDSDADVSNWMLRGEAFVQWRHGFCELKGSIPVIRHEDTEQWYRSGALAQTNTIEYGWTRIDGHLGLLVTPFFNPYVGIRWSQFDQERTDFILNGSPITGRATETVTAWYVFFGARGHIPLYPHWQLIYSGAYFRPLSSEVTSTNLPGWEVRDEDGYVFELEARLEYAVTPRVSIAAILYGGRVHWEGSDWQPVSPGNLAKWPENDTEYFGGLLSVRWSF